MKLLSLFDGEGGFPLAGVMNGVEPVAASEIEPYPIAITRSRFPSMRHLGSVTEIDGAKIEPVDIATFGSPCQDMSIAGKRDGLKHEELGDEDSTRSGLFFEAVRIIKEMRKATNGKHPRFAVWENVPGAFSSNGGRDFLSVLQALASVSEPALSIPEPERDGKTDNLVWLGAGSIVGNGFSIAWRTLDAQYWGVPQRRKRIYLVADFGSERAAEILFEQTCLRGNIAESGETRERTAEDAARRTDGSLGIECLNPWDCQSKRVFLPEGIYPTLPAMDGGGANNQAVIFSFDSLSSNSMKSANPNSGCREVDVAKCIDTTFPDPSKNQGGVCVVQSAVGFDRYNGELTGDTNQTLAGMTRDNNVPHVIQPVIADAAAFDSLMGAKASNIGYEEGRSPTLHQNVPSVVYPVIDTLCFDTTQVTSKCNRSKPNWGDPCHTISAQGDAPTVIALQANGIDRADTAGCNGAGWREDQSYTLNTVDRHAVCYPDVCGTLAASGAGLNRPAGQGNEADSCIVSKSESNRRFIVRRLMPIETTRLQGYPKIVEVDMKSATADEVAIIAIREGFISVFPETGEVYAARGPGGIRRKEPLLLRGTIMNGYVVYKLHAAGAKKMVRANRLVWIAENGAIPRGMCVDHINSNKTDNRIANLQLLTPIENSKKAHADGLYKTGDFAGATKIKEHDKRVLSFIYWHYKIPYTRIAPMFGIKRSRAQQIIHEYTWHELAPFDGDVEFWESVRKTWARINGTEYKPFKTVERLEKWYYKLRNDGAEYKADGNSLAMPCAEYVIRRIVEIVKKESEETT